MNPAKALREQLGKLQRLAQPYFLPLEEGRTGGGSFILLLAALLAALPL
jgi:putative ATP-binding cassette transporter